MKRQANHSVLKSTAATVLSPGPRTFGAPEPKASGPPHPPGVEEVRALRDSKPERRERSGSVSRTPLEPTLEKPKAAAAVDSVPLSGLDKRPSRGRSNSGSQPSTSGAGRAAAVSSVSKSTVSGTEVPASSPSFPSESGRRARRPSREVQQAASLDDELEALLNAVEESDAASSGVGASKKDIAQEPRLPEAVEPRESREPKEPSAAAAPAAPAAQVPAGQERCSVCGAEFKNGQSIYESTVAGQKQVLCSGCWSQVAPHCIACGKLISGPMAKVGDDAYHQECLKCTICSKVIDGALSKLDCGICCGGCTDEVDKDLRELRKLLQAGDLEGAALLEGSLKARGIKPPELKSPDLGCCSSCQLPFKPGQQVYQKDQDSKMLCEACFLSAAPPCAVCGKPVVGTVAKVGENSYHPECLLCSSCGVQLTGSFTKTDTGFRCSECQTA